MLSNVVQCEYGMCAREKYKCRNMNGWQGVLLNFHILHLSYSHRNLIRRMVSPHFSGKNLRLRKSHIHDRGAGPECSHSSLTLSVRCVWYNVEPQSPTCFLSTWVFPGHLPSPSLFVHLALQMLLLLNLPTVRSRTGILLSSGFLAPFRAVSRQSRNSF